MSDLIDVSFRVEGGLWSHEAPAPPAPENPMRVFARLMYAAGQQMGEGIVAGMTTVVQAIKRFGMVVDRVSRVPAGAAIVRPLGHRSNSRQWLAWDGRSWQPCRRRSGIWYWGLEERG